MLITTPLTTQLTPIFNAGSSGFSTGNQNSLVGGLAGIPVLQALDRTFAGLTGFAGRGPGTDLSLLRGYAQTPLMVFGAEEAPKGKKPKKVKSALIKGSLAHQVAAFYLGEKLDGGIKPKKR